MCQALTAAIAPRAVLPAISPTRDAANAHSRNSFAGSLCSTEILSLLQKWWNASRLWPYFCSVESAQACFIARSTFSRASLDRPAAEFFCLLRGRALAAPNEPRLPRLALRSMSSEIACAAAYMVEDGRSSAAYVIFISFFDQEIYSAFRDYKKFMYAIYFVLMSALCTV
jgi:hypothetical protein